MKTKVLLKSKTFWTGISTIALGIGLYLSGEQDLQAVIITVVGILFTYLRTITDTKISGIK